MVGFVDRPDGLDAMSPEVVGGVLQVFLCVHERPHGRANLRMALPAAGDAGDNTSTSANRANRPVNLFFIFPPRVRNNQPAYGGGHFDNKCRSW
jgi:hypothetical protein